MTIVSSSHLSHGNVEGCLCLPQPSRHMDTVNIRVEALAEHHSVERSIKLYTNLKREKSSQELQYYCQCTFQAALLGSNYSP